MRTTRSGRPRISRPTRSSDSRRIAISIGPFSCFNGCAISIRTARFSAKASAQLEQLETMAAATTPPSLHASGRRRSRRTIRAVQREVLPEVVRVTVELDREVPFYQERIEGPARLFFDLKGTKTVPALVDATLPLRLGHRSAHPTRAPPEQHDPHRARPRKCRPLQRVHALQPVSHRHRRRAVRVGSSRMIDRSAHDRSRDADTAGTRAAHKALNSRNFAPEHAVAPIAPHRHAALLNRYRRLRAPVARVVPVKRRTAPLHLLPPSHMRCPSHPLLRLHPSHPPRRP